MMEGMRSYRDSAVVLRQHKLGEADYILTLLTRDNGLVRAVNARTRETKTLALSGVQSGWAVGIGALLLLTGLALALLAAVARRSRVALQALGGARDAVRQACAA
mgnify:CR=1 FL=1